jgi:hypothetical protein
LNSITLPTCAMNWRGATIQPSRQPVIVQLFEKVLTPM